MNFELNKLTLTWFSSIKRFHEIVVRLNNCTLIMLMSKPRLFHCNSSRCTTLRPRWSKIIISNTTVGGVKGLLGVKSRLRSSVRSWTLIIRSRCLCSIWTHGLRHGNHKVIVGFGTSRWFNRTSRHRSLCSCILSCRIVSLMSWFF
jgi:hypothetical protein